MMKRSPRNENGVATKVAAPFFYPLNAQPDTLKAGFHMHQRHLHQGLATLS